MPLAIIASFGGTFLPPRISDEIVTGKEVLYYNSKQTSMVRRAGGGNIENQEQRGSGKRSESRFGKSRFGSASVCGGKSFRRNNVKCKQNSIITLLLDYNNKFKYFRPAKTPSCNLKA
ncbi:hypothetical protein J6590_070407 [Homalodisca vitripennis]|nr:hypothetical protein J6590_070407 [Homalodisca vitripennis]